jgi:hypothetical protein
LDVARAEFQLQVRDVSLKDLSRRVRLGSVERARGGDAPVDDLDGVGDPLLVQIIDPLLVLKIIICVAVAVAE